MCPQVGGLFCHTLNLDLKWSLENKNQSSFWTCSVFTFTLSIQEFVKGCGSVTKHWVDGLLDKMTAGDHIKAVSQIRQVFDLYLIHTHLFHNSVSLEGCLDQFYQRLVSVMKAFLCAYFTFQKRNIMLKPDETKSNICDIQVCCSFGMLYVMVHVYSCLTVLLKLRFFGGVFLLRWQMALAWERAAQSWTSCQWRTILICLWIYPCWTH